MSRLRKLITGVVVFGTAAALAFVTMNLVQNVQHARAQQEVESTRKQLAQVEELASVFRDVSSVVEPSVVEIKITRKASTIPGHSMPFDEETLRRSLPDRDGDGEPDMPEGFRGLPFEQQGNGSGVVMDIEDGHGYIITNNHVVAGASEIDVTLHDGREIKQVTVVGTDPRTDIAVIKVPAERLIAAKWGDSDTLRKGDWVLAFGSPFGYIGSMTHGIVSALNRNRVGILGPMGYESFIQVDAPINPGNSGGPLVNIHGEVVGINTAIASRSGGSVGVGFAIPSNQAREIYTTIREKGRVVRGFLGVAIDDVASPRDPRSEAMLRQSGYQGKQGVLVIEVSAGTPAFGKLEPGDVITEYAGKPAETVQQLRSFVAATAPGTEVPLAVTRDGDQQTISLTIGEQPETLQMARSGGSGRGFGRGQASTNVEKLGLRLSTLSPELAERYELTGVADAGAVITAVAPGSSAAAQGLRPGDTITRIGKQSVSSAEEAAKILSEADLAAGVTLRVVNSESSRIVALTLEP